MSDVNQAFLRAYVKSRTASGTRESQVEPTSSQPLPAAQPHVQRRVDLPASPAPASPAAAPASNQVKVGVWSALGVERGMKASVTTQPPPAVVRNSVTPVPVESTLPRPQVRSHAAPPAAAHAPASLPPAARRENAPTPKPLPHTRATHPSGAHAQHTSAALPNSTIPTSPVAHPHAAATAPALEKSPSLETLSQAWSKKRAPALNNLTPKSSSAPTPPSAPTISSAPMTAGTSRAPNVSHRTPNAIPAAHTPAAPQNPGVRLRVDTPYTTIPASFPDAERTSAGPYAREPFTPDSYTLEGHTPDTYPAARYSTGQHVVDAPAAAPYVAPAPGIQPPTPALPNAVQTRIDPPSNRQFSGPHAAPSTQRTIDKSRLQELPLPVAFAPSWEVDTFFWPEVVTRLEQNDPSAFQQIGRHLADANHSGLKVLAVTSGERGVGRSTVAMHIARAAAQSGLKVALVDTDAFQPSLVDQLRLDVQHGWQDCLFEAIPLEEVAVHSISDRVTLFPLTGVVSQQQVHANLHRMSKLIRRISTAFDLVVLDSSRLNLDQRDLIGVSNESVVDAAVVVVDTELSIKEKIDSAISMLQAMGLSSIGLIENFRS